MNQINFERSVHFHDVSSACIVILHILSVAGAIKVQFITSYIDESIYYAAQIKYLSCNNCKTYAPLQDLHSECMLLHVYTRHGISNINEPP